MQARDHVHATLQQRAEALAAQGDGTTLRAGQLHTLAAALDVPITDAPAVMSAVPEGAPPYLGDAMVALWPYADLYVPGERWCAVARPSYGDLDGRGITAVAESLTRARTSAESLATHAQGAPLAAAQLVPSSPALDEALAFCDSVTRLPEALLLPLCMVSGDPTALARAHDALTRWRTHGAALVQSTRG